MKQRHDMEALIHDGPLRWSVTSRTRPEIQHLVDLEGFGGIGTCSCEHFQFRIAPELRENRRLGARRCSHILVAREAFTDAMIQTIIRGRETTAQPEEEELPVCQKCGPGCLNGDPVRPCRSCGEPIGHGAWQHECAICGGPCCTGCSHDGAFNRVVCEGCHYDETL